jgi:hypothetical protein
MHWWTKARATGCLLSDIVAPNRPHLVLSKKMASIVIAYGIALAGLGFILQQASPGLAGITFVTALAGGGLCVLWGVVGLTSHKRRAWAVLTLIAVAFIVLSQVVHAWLASATEAPGRLVDALLLSFIMLLTVAMIMYLLHGERPPEFYMIATTGSEKVASRAKDARSEQARRQPERK